MVKSRDDFFQSQDNQWGVLKSDSGSPMTENENSESTHLNKTMTRRVQKFDGIESLNASLEFLNPPNDMDGIFVDTICCPSIHTVQNNTK